MPTKRPWKSWLTKRVGRHTNGLDEALAHAIRDGSRYYTLDYVPTNKEMNGRYRRINVKLTHRHYKTCLPARL